MATAPDTQLLAPWERQPGEGPKPFEAFVIYRNAGLTRSAAKVAEQLGKSRTLISRWSAAHAWVVRAEAWDREQDRIDLLERLELRKKALKRHAIYGESLQTKAGTRLANISTADLEAKDVVRWLDVGVRLEREALGIAPEPVGQHAQQAAGDDATLPALALSPEERRARLLSLRRELHMRLDATEPPDDDEDDG